MRDHCTRCEVRGARCERAGRFDRLPDGPYGRANGGAAGRATLREPSFGGQALPPQAGLRQGERGRGVRAYGVPMNSLRIR